MSATPFASGAIRGYLHAPEKPGNHGLAITHGAGGNCTSALLVAIASAFSAEGFLVLRFDLPFRQQRPHGPPTAGRAAKDQAGIQEAVTWMRTKVTGKVFMGGQSYGGRQASMLAAENPACTDGLLLLSYPLHAPGSPKMRTDHFPALTHPVLFIQGTKDPFASPEELREAIKLITAPTEISLVDRAGHDLKSGSFDIETFVLQPFQRLFGC